MTKRITALVAAVLVAMAGVVALAAPAGAHAGNQSYIYLDVSSTDVAGRLEIPVGDLESTLDIELGDGPDELVETLATEAEVINGYLSDHLTIELDGDARPVELGEPEPFYSDLPENDDNYIVIPFDVDTGGRDVPRRFDVTFDPFFDEIEGRDALLLIGNDWEGGVIENSHDVFVAFSADSRTQEIDLGGTSGLKTLTASVELGVDHIRTGPDHILFVLVLVLPSVLVFRSVWRPAANFGSSLWRVTKIVTMFTVAHTITFSLAGLDILPLPPSKFVESIIAISIAAAALHNLRPVVANKEWAIAFVFGLFHGMGFASLVEGLEVSQATQLWSLLGRNIGIEIGQAAVVLLTFPALFLLRRTRYYMGFFTVASVLLAAVSVGWMIERVFEIDLKVGAAIDPIVKWPRSLFAIIVLTGVAALIQRREAAAGRLLPVDGESDDAEPPRSDEQEPAFV